MPQSYAIGWSIISNGRLGSNGEITRKRKQELNSTTYATTAKLLTVYEEINQ